MTDTEEVFQCDYCGKFAPINQAIMAWAEDWQTDDERTVFTVSIACSPWCADQVNDLRVAR